MFQFLRTKVERSPWLLSHETRQRDTKIDLRTLFQAWRNALLRLPQLWPISSQHDPEPLNPQCFMIWPWIICSLHAIEKFRLLSISFLSGWHHSPIKLSLSTAIGCGRKESFCSMTECHGIFRAPSACRSGLGLSIIRGQAVQVVGRAPGAWWSRELGSR